MEEKTKVAWAKGQVYRVKRKGLKTVIEELRQRMLAKSPKVGRFEQRIEQLRRQSRFFSVDQKRITQKLMEGEEDQAMIQMQKKVKYFWVILGVFKKGTT